MYDTHSTQRQTPFENVRMEHPLVVTGRDRTVVVADTAEREYNFELSLLARRKWRSILAVEGSVRM